MREKSNDTFFGGNIFCAQYKDGYRFSIDSVLLAHFPAVRKNDMVLDLGSGCGVIGLIMMYRHKDYLGAVKGLEVQTDMVHISRENIAKNEFEPNFTVIHGSAKQYRRIIEPESFSLVISNPPYYKSGSGRVNVGREQEISRHQSSELLDDFIDCASFSVKNRGRVAFVYPAESMSRLITAFKKRRLEPKKIRFVYSYPNMNGSAKLVLVEAVKNGGSGVDVMAPLYIYESKNGPYTSEVELFYAA